MIEELKDCIERNQTKEILKKNGWTLRSDTSITQMKKSELLEYIRMLEHNWACALMRHENTIRYIEGTINAKSAEDIKF